ncbi:MAG: alpha/beta hydrolase family protein [Verrucomicrobiales bacterium]
MKTVVAAPLALFCIATPLMAASHALSGTEPLEWTGDLAAKMVDGIHAYLDRATAAVTDGRREKREISPASVPAMRERLREQLGLTRPLADDFASPPSSFTASVPILGRGQTIAGSPGFREAKLPPREFLWRAFFELGHTLVGEDVRRTLAAVDAAKRNRPKAAVAVTGTGDAGMVALFAAAIDPRIDMVVVGGYFGPREAQWQEPIDRTIFGLWPEFGDGELAALIAPRRLIVETTGYPEWDSPPVPAAPGKLAPVSRAAIETEARRARSLASGDWLILSDNATTSKKLLSDDLADGTVINIEATDDPALYLQYLEQTQELMRGSQKMRAQFWQKADFSSTEKFVASTSNYRQNYWEDVIGKLPSATMPANPRSRLVFETERFRGWEVVLDVVPDVFSYGILLLPKDLKPGEKRPVIVCQHGLEGRPADLADPKADHPAYHAYGARLAEEGFIVFAPQNPYIGKTHFRQVCRKAWPLGLSLWSFIVAQHQRSLEWLAAQEFVDAHRIGFYGLSYGGKTAMRIPALLDGYCLSICSADYNEWIWKNCDARAPYSYLYTMEYDMVEWNLANTFNYAELSWLIFPRPFMVERGHDDGVSCDEWVAYEFARTFRHYSKLGQGDKAAIEFFNGPHTINGKGTFEFLRKHLNWP